ncbi:hypothetical protein MTR_3g017430 [Medicago truncatula]|uniref:Reverse transcriptase zinc-binding domain-containing protein n=1 Tax=Medicago truncatula TaxID=3880 RepID=G7IYV1_MEDTR|nr:hypothetical protein MTR_3g017430 [Medicago truncatula]
MSYIFNKRGILQVADARCVSGCDTDESASHLFLHCEVFGSLWQHIRSWIGVNGVDPQNITQHFYQFTHYTCHSKARKLVKFSSRVYLGKQVEVNSRVAKPWLVEIEISGGQ